MIWRNTKYDAKSSATLCLGEPGRQDNHPGEVRAHIRPGIYSRSIRRLPGHAGVHPHPDRGVLQLWRGGGRPFCLSRLPHFREGRQAPPYGCAYAGHRCRRRGAGADQRHRHTDGLRLYRHAERCWRWGRRPADTTSGAGQPGGRGPRRQADGPVCRLRHRLHGRGCRRARWPPAFPRSTRATLGSARYTHSRRCSWPL